MLDFLLDKTSLSYFQNKNVLSQIRTEIFTAEKYRMDYDALEKRQKQIKLANSLMEKRLQGYNRNEAVKTLTDSKKNLKNASDVQKWLKDLKAWAIKSYKLIMRLRKLITGQDFVYHIMDSKKEFIYELNEEQFLNLISEKSLDLGGRSGWKTVTNKLTNPKNPANLGDLFEFRVNVNQMIDERQVKLRGGSASMAEWMKQKAPNAPRHNIKKDPLYKYIQSRTDIQALQTKKGKFSHATGLEVYDQLYYFFEWKKTKNQRIVTITSSNSKEGFFIERYQEIKDALDDYFLDIAKFKPGSFYSGGDAIASETKLIENKLQGATVSIRTIKNAIKDISNLQFCQDINQLKNNLKKIFIKKGTSNFLKEIENAAYEKAVNVLEDIFKIK